MVSRSSGARPVRSAEPGDPALRFDRGSGEGRSRDGHGGRPDRESDDGVRPGPQLPDRDRGAPPALRVGPALPPPPPGPARHPDFVFPKHRSAVFVHGCFRHRHGCESSSIPAARPDWRRQKPERNAERDAEAVSRLRRPGWRVLTIRECRFRRAGVNRDRALDEACREAAAFVRSSSPVPEIPRSACVVCSGRRTPGPDS